MVRRTLGTCGAAMLATAACGSPVLFVDDDAPPGGNGSSWDSALTFLQDALTVASIPGVGITEIRLGQGTYTPDSTTVNPAGTGNRQATFQLISGVEIWGGYAGVGAPNPNLHHTELYPTYLSGDLAGNDGPDFSGNDENSYHVIIASDTDESAVLAGVYVIGGNADGEGDPVCFGGPNNGAPCSQGCGGAVCVSPDSVGAGILALNGRATLFDCRIVDNFASFQGAGAMLKYGSDVSIIFCVFSGNRALDNGGAMYMGDSSPLITDTTFTGNSGGRYAGATCNRDHSDAMFINCTFIDNTAAEETETGGGAVVNASSSPTFTDCAFIGNRSIAGRGGAIYNKMGFNPQFGPSQPVFQNCSFAGNTAATSGGALYNIEGSGAAFTDCSITDGVAETGGNLYNAEGCTISLAGCTVSGGSAAEGGGLYNTGAAALTDTTFTLNEADDRGGGIYSSGPASGLELVGCTMGDDNADQGVEIYASSGGSAVLDDCLVGGGISGSPPPPPYFLGGIYVKDPGTTLSLTGCTITSYDNFGVYSTDGSVSIQTCEFEEAGVRSTGSTAQLVMTDTTVSAFGRAVLAGGTAELTRCTLTGLPVSGPNTSGGIETSGTTVVTLTDCTLTDGTAERGAALRLQGSGTQATIVRCVLTDNLATLSGGAVNVQLGAQATFVDCVLDRNQSEFSGGAIYSTGGDLDLVNCSLRENLGGEYIGTGDGGAVYAGGGSLTMTNCTVVDNWAGHEGGGTYTIDNSPVLTNGIFWDNSDGGPPYEFDQVRHYATEGELVINYCCVQNWTGDFGGVGNMGDYPMLVDGRLSPGSPCIDAGDALAVPADELDVDDDGDLFEPVPTDLDGNPRFADDTCADDAKATALPPVDIGACEFQGTSPSDLVGDVTADCIVGIDDFLLLLATWGCSGDCAADIDGSGDVGLVDFLLLLNYWTEP